MFFVGWIRNVIQHFSIKDVALGSRLCTLQIRLNDIAVDSVKSNLLTNLENINNIEDIACDHVSYFFNENGLKALAKAIEG